MLGVCANSRSTSVYCTTLSSAAILYHVTVIAFAGD